MDTFFRCDITEPRLGSTDTPALEEILQAVGFLKPEPSPFPLVRIGGCRDGAYLLPDDLDGITACFSPGVFNRKDFEDELAHSHSIRSHMCDYSSDPSRFRTPLIEDMQTFDKKWLDTENTDKALTATASLICAR